MSIRLRYQWQDLSNNDLRTEGQTILDILVENDTIADRLAQRGWTADRIEGLQELFDVYVSSAQRFVTLEGQREATSKRFESELDAFRRGAFNDHVGLVDAALLDAPDARAALGIDDGLSNLRTPFREWQPRAADFYSRLRSDANLLGALSSVHLSADELEDGADEVTHLFSLHRTRRELDAERQQARRDRDAHRLTVEVEFRQMQKVAKIVLRDRPDLLEKLGFVAEDVAGR